MNDDEYFQKVFRYFGSIWLVMLLIGIGLTGFGVWTVWRLVMHFAP